MDIVKAIYDMMGKYTYPVLKDDAPRQHVEVFFQVLLGFILTFLFLLYNLTATTFLLALYLGSRISMDLQSSRTVFQCIQFSTLAAFYKCINLMDSNTLCFSLLQKMDKNKDGVVTLDEFIESCQEVRIDFLLQ